LKNGQIFEWGLKAKVLESCLAPLNGLDIFKGTLKIGTLKDCWRRADKVAEEIISYKEILKFVKLAQKGWKEMSKLDMHLAKLMKTHWDTRQEEKDETYAEKTDAQNRLT
jgi:hypothetical protein